MKARNKFLVGGAIVLGTSGFLMWNATQETGISYYTPGEYLALAAKSPDKLKNDVRVGAIAVPGTIVRQPGGRDYFFRAAFEKDTLNVKYHGIAPDTFTDGVNVVVEGHLENGTFVASTLLAKCASRYENGPPGATPARNTSAGANGE